MPCWCDKSARARVYTYTRVGTNSMSLRWNKLNQNVNRFSVEPCLARSRKQERKWFRNRREDKRAMKMWNIYIWTKASIFDIILFFVDYLRLFQKLFK